MTMKNYTIGTLAVMLIGGAFTLLVAPPYVQAVIATVLIYTIAVSGLNLLGGYGGYPNLTQATFMGVAAYAAAWVTNHTGLGFWVQILVTPLVAALVALIVAVPLLRLRGQYFAIATLLLGVVLTTIVTNWKDLGSSVGIGGFVRPGHGQTQWLILLIAVATLVTLAIARVVTRPMGRHLVALRKDEALSESIGIPVYRRKLQAFVIGGYVAGIAGVLLAYNSYFIAPELFNFYESFLLFVALIVGGAGTLSGPLIGSIFLVGLPELFRFAAEGRYLTMGLVFIAVMALAPDGLAGVFGRAATALRRHNRSLQPPPTAPQKVSASLERSTSSVGS